MTRKNIDKSVYALIRAVTAAVGLFAVILVFLFIGYVYALQTNPSLYIPVFSDQANKVIGVLWKKPYAYPTPTNTPSELYGVPKPAAEWNDVTKWHNSEPISLATFKDKKIVVLTFGRMYCSYCLNVYTFLNEFQRQYSTYIQVIGIQSPKYDQERVWDDVVAKIKERDVIFPVGFDENRKVKQLYEVDLVPIVYIIDKQGMIRYHHLGEGGYAEVEKALKEIIQLDFGTKYP
ncbi:redoxin domain-containing protein [Candidatus Woesebacteria bacterium]|nr:redoxin domain-containing protein [Candidatus Woesebacteria bacterium]